jgi:hypothetical protein
VTGWFDRGVMVVVVVVIGEGSVGWGTGGGCGVIGKVGAAVGRC